MNSEQFIAAMRAYGADADDTLRRFMGDADLYMDCVRLLLKDPAPHTLEHALRARDYPAAFDAAHSIKGLAANLGLTPLLDGTCALVEALRDKAGWDDARLAALYGEVRGQFDRLAALMA